MKIKLILTLVILLGTMSLFSIFDDYEPSARARAMGGAFYTISDDASAIFYNPAGLNLADDNLKLGYAKLFGNDFQLLNTIAFSMKLPKKFGKLGIGMRSMNCTYLDITLESEKIYSLTHAFTVMKDIHSELYLGYTGNFYNLTINTFGAQNSFGLDVGALAIIHQRTRLAFGITNINNPKVGESNDFDLPRKFTIGIAYQPYYHVSTSLELKKTFDKQETEIHAGTEFEVYDFLVLRAGLRNYPASYSMGFGINFHGILIDYGFNTHEIGPTHHFGIGYNL